MQQFQLGTGPLDSRVAYTTFSKRLGSRADFEAESATNQTAFGMLVDKWAGNVALAVQGTNTGPALYTTYSAWTSWTKAQTSPRRSKKVAIIITDGMPNNIEGCGEAGLLSKLAKSWRPANIKDKELKALDCARTAFALLNGAVQQVVYVNMGDRTKSAKPSHASSVKGLFPVKENDYIEGTYKNMSKVFDRISSLVCNMVQ